ncbi:antihemorrhagic factor cHLP-B-like [Seriola lalandi dorsalis]|uniref:Antihemorrhagic factor cHLP-B-like n=1 Tax=Seriola lalandi dorsalis TaxID=1841481 RepID=A0A3B4XMK2_SERLL|nr:antihemorrhagic factor cHLP-B-like [Seriola lalandi dorsalis]
MKRLIVLTLLSSALLLCSAAPALERVTCTGENTAAGGRMAVRHINEHHHHGYKFQLDRVYGVMGTGGGDRCNLHLELGLLETDCHVVNPKHFEDCNLRSDADWEVMANCTVGISIISGNAKIVDYNCITRRVKTNMEMAMIYADLPILVPLNDSDGLKSVHEAVKKFNQNTTNQHYYILQEVGRIKSGYMMVGGMFFSAQFVVVETHCPMGSRILPEACKPLCPDRAHHAYCRSFYSMENGLGDVECDFYPPVNTTALAPGEPEPVCRPPHPAHHPGLPPYHGPSAPPPHAGGRPPHGHGHGHPPHIGGRPPRPHGLPDYTGPHTGQIPPPFNHCDTPLINSDPAVHPICPWHLPYNRPQPRPSQS